MEQPTFAQRVMSSWLNAPAGSPELAMFTDPRPEGQIDMVAAVREALIGAGLAQCVQECFDNDKTIIDASPVCENAQRFLLNKFWMHQLLALEVDTQRERFVLLDTGDAKHWIHLFKEVILPTAIVHRLPKAL